MATSAKKPKHNPFAGTLAGQGPAQNWRRRDLLLGLGSGALLLGSIAKPRRANAATPVKDRRFLVMYTPNGHHNSTFGSDGNGASFAFKAGMAKAEAVKDHVSVIRNLSVKNRDGTGFHDYLPMLLTGLKSSRHDYASGPSIDQVVANLNGKPPVNVKIYTDSFNNNMGNHQLLSWRQASFPNRNVDKPVKVYESLFGMVMPQGGSTNEGKAILEQDKSLLDFVNEDLKLFKGRLSSSADKERLDLHLETVREAELKVKTVLDSGGTSVAAAACDMTAATKAGMYAPPPQGSASPGNYNKAQFEMHGEAMRKLIVAGFACGAANAGTFLWQIEGGGLNPNGGVGQADDHHWVSHGEGGAGTWTAVDSYYSGQYANFLNDFKAAGILDDTIIVWTSLLRDFGPADHSLNDLIFVVGGGKNLGIKHRQSIVFPTAPGDGGDAARSANVWGSNDLWTTILRATGGTGNFGEFTKGPIEPLWSPVT
jgi:hypothetical protein